MPKLQDEPKSLLQPNYLEFIPSKNYIGYHSCVCMHYHVYKGKYIYNYYIIVSSYIILYYVI
jgi:hypothetical protein